MDKIKELKEALEQIKSLVKNVESKIEALEPEVGDVCKFWHAYEDDFVISILIEKDKTDVPYKNKLGCWHKNAKKLTKEEAIKLLFGKGE